LEETTGPEKVEFLKEVPTSKKAKKENKEAEELI
jgi:hypothetical protein